MPPNVGVSGFLRVQVFPRRGAESGQARTAWSGATNHVIFSRAFLVFEASVETTDAGHVGAAEGGHRSVGRALLALMEQE